MVKESNFFSNTSTSIDLSSGFSETLLIHETSFSRLFRVKRMGKYFIIKTTKDNSSIQKVLLKREYELSIKLNHYHLPYFYSYEENTPVGTGIIMEYVDGRNLNDFLKENPPLTERKKVLLQLLEVIEYIHKNDIIHNDIKPGNILISYLNNDVKLIDFGLSNDDSHYLTKSMGGTLTYASPELITQKEDIDARSDIYSIGMIIKIMFHENKYLHIANKCTHKNKEDRYKNIQQLKKSILQSNSEIVIKTLTISIIISISSFSLYNWLRLKNNETIHSTQNKTLVDSLRIVREKSRILQEKYDSLASAYTSSEQLRSRYNHRRDSLTKNIDKRLQKLYNQIKQDIEDIPYFEFATSYLADNVQDAINLGHEINNMNIDNELKNIIYTHYDRKWIEYYNNLFSTIALKPTIQKDNMSSEEYNFYIMLLNDNKPYKPYTSQQEHNQIRQ